MTEVTKKDACNRMKDELAKSKNWDWLTWTWKKAFESLEAEADYEQMKKFQ